MAESILIPYWVLVVIGILIVVAVLHRVHNNMNDDTHIAVVLFHSAVFTVGLILILNGCAPYINTVIDSVTTGEVIKFVP